MNGDCLIKMNNLTPYRILSFLLILFAGLTAAAQKTAVSGKVTDAEIGETLPFVNVVLWVQKAELTLISTETTQ